MTKRPKPKLRTPENAARICTLLAEGHTLRQAAQQLGCDHSAILHWVRQDEEAGGIFCHQYTRAREAGCLLWADELVEISDANYVGPDGRVDNAAVQQARLRSDNRKWLLARMLPRQFGDRVTQAIETEDGSGPITLIRLIPVDPRPRPEADAEVASGGEAIVTPLRALPSR